MEGSPGRLDARLWSLPALPAAAVALAILAAILVPKPLSQAPVLSAQQFVTSISPSPPLCAVESFQRANKRLPLNRTDLVAWASNTGEYDPISEEFGCSAAAEAGGAQSAASLNKQAADFAGSFSPPPPVCAVQAFVAANGAIPKGWNAFVDWSASKAHYDPATQSFQC